MILDMGTLAPYSWFRGAKIPEKSAMTSKDLRRWQFEQLRATIAPKLRYFARLHDRVCKLGIGPDDPLLRVARDAHDAVFTLFTTLHTLENEAFKRERDAARENRKPGDGGDGS